MMRRQLTFACEGAVLLATLDDAPGTTALLIVSGGNEIRAGAWGGQALLAARIAAAGHPVLRFDRRGVGESEGANAGFRGSGADIAAALGLLRDTAPHVRRVVGLGNCDAASALMLARGAGCDGLVLANPWVIDGEEAPEAIPAQAVRARYLAKLRDPREVWRLLRGGVDLGKLARGLRIAARRAPAPPPLAEAMRDGLAAFEGPVRILLAEQDRTAQLFLAAWDARDPRIARVASNSHSFADRLAREFLAEQVLAALGVGSV